MLNSQILRVEKTLYRTCEKGRELKYIKIINGEDERVAVINGEDKPH